MGQRAGVGIRLDKLDVDDIDFVTVQTCHREIIIRNKDYKRGIAFQLSSIEADGYCPILIQTFTKDRLYSAAMLDLDGSGLNATIDCNGAITNFKGVGVCQSRIGMIQQIEFAEPVKITDPQSGCDSLQKQSDSKFRWRTSKGKCVYLFKGLVSGAIHRLTTNGYEEFYVH